MREGPVARSTKTQLVVGTLALALVLAGDLISAPLTLAAEPTGWDVGATPVSGPQQAPKSYFSFKLLAGQSATGAVLVVNYKAEPVPIMIAPVLGVTALDSGDAYRSPSNPCQGAACWVFGLLGRQTLGAGANATFAFRVTVPAGTPPGQYLAGILIQPPLGAAKPGSPGSSSFQIRVQQQVVVGVAVTVGAPTSLKPQLSISRVTVTNQPVLRLMAEVSNRGNAFDHPEAGLASLRTPGGTTRSFSLAGGTILPQSTANLDINLGHIAPGSYPARVSIWYAGHSREAVWSGVIVVPTASTVQVQHRQSTTLLISGGIPGWAWATMGILAALVLALLVVLLFWYRRRRQAEAA